MKTTRYMYWQDDDMWLGYLENFPDYQTQAHDLQELQENLLDLYKDLSTGAIPNVRQVGELKIA